MNYSQHPLETILIDNKPSVSCAKLPPTSHSLIENKPKAPGKIELTCHSNTLPNTIDLDKIQGPALLLNSQLKIVWQNTQAMENIWHTSTGWDHYIPGPDIFELFFDPAFQRNVANFSNCIKFFLYQICAMATEEHLRKRIQTLDKDPKAVILSLLGQMGLMDSTESVYRSYLHQTLRSGEMLSFEVVAINLNEGRLLVFELQKNPNNLLQSEPHQHIKHHIEKLRRQPEPVKTSYVLLVAQLNKADIFRTQMLADEYRRLIHDLCRKSLYKVEQYGGIFGKHIESGFFVYFLSDPDRSEKLLKIIECAFEIKQLMIQLGREWKIRKDWLHDVELNMGLHWEHEYVDILRSSAGEAITSFGDGLQVAAAISQLAQDGQIWATKALIQQLSTASHKQLRFGILRPDSLRYQPFIRNGFAFIEEVFDPKKTNILRDKGFHLLPVTQIFDLSGSIS
jgi:class 3 adenylate cyclase